MRVSDVWVLGVPLACVAVLAEADGDIAGAAEGVKQEVKQESRTGEFRGKRVHRRVGKKAEKPERGEK